MFMCCTTKTTKVGTTCHIISIRFLSLPSCVWFSFLGRCTILFSDGWVRFYEGGEQGSARPPGWPAPTTSSHHQRQERPSQPIKQAKVPSSSLIASQPPNIYLGPEMRQLSQTLVSLAVQFCRSYKFLDCRFLLVLSHIMFCFTVGI